MAVTVNWNSIKSKQNAAVKSSAFQSKMKQLVSMAIVPGDSINGTKIHTPDEAGAKLVEVLKDSINSSGLDAATASAISSSVAVSGISSMGDNKWEIIVTFATERSSILPDKYGSTDIGAVYDLGVGHKMKQIVLRDENGKATWRSRTVIPGVHFKETAIANFMGNYGTEYGVISIS